MTDTPTSPATDTETDTTEDSPSEPQFSLEETRRLASLDAAKSITANNMEEFLANAKAVESFLKGPEPETPTTDEPPTEPPAPS